MESKTTNTTTTTIRIPKILRDKLAVIKFKSHLDELHQVIQLLYNTTNLTELEESNSGINAGEQTKEVVTAILPNPETTLNNQFALNVKEEVE